jgi:hypothetical protein
VNKFLGFLTGKKTIFTIFGGGILASMPDWAAALPPGASVVTVVLSWVQAYWQELALIFAAMKANRMIASPTP